MSDRTCWSGHWQAILCVVQAVVFWTAVTVGGCALPSLEKETGFRNQGPDWGDRLRPSGQRDGAFGVSEKARQVEHNLGVD